MGSITFEQVLEFALEHNKQTGQKVYVYGTYLITARQWFYSWSANKVIADSRKLNRDLK